MKFVKGDSIAGLVITAVNIVAGIIIGVTQMGFTAGEAIEIYGILTIGDGLVSQIPALIGSMSAGLIVTRVASEDEDANLGQDISTQVLAQPKAFAVAASLLLGIGIIPGLPTVPFLMMAFLVGGLAYLLMRGQMAEQEGPKMVPPIKSSCG